MPKEILNGIEYGNGIDHQKLLKIGDAPLDTTADNLSDAVNELNSALSLLQGQLQVQVNDLNTPLNEGCALITLNTYPASASNKPTANSGIIMSFGTGRFRQQIAFELAGAIYTRYYDNGSFTAWTQRG